MARVARVSAVGPKRVRVVGGRCGWLGRMRIVPLVADDIATVEACYEVSQAVTRADDPLGPPMSARVWKT